jgi:hypothetical protein
MIRVGRRKAFFRAGAWRSSDRALEASLNELTQRWLRDTGGPPLKESDQELAIAREMARRTGGRISAHVPSYSQALRRHFFARRQMVFAFGDDHEHA